MSPRREEYAALAAVPFVVRTVEGGLYWKEFRQAHGVDALAKALRAEAIRGTNPEGFVKLELLHLMAFRWFCLGLPRLVIGHRHAAAIMLTRVPADLIPEVRAPWDTFMVDVPDGLIDCPALTGMGVPDSPTGTHSIRHAFVGRRDDEGIYVFGATRSHPVMYLRGESFPGLASLEGEGRADDRAYELLAKYVLGAAIEAGQYRPALAHAAGQRAVKRDHRGAPVTHTFTLTRDVRIDARRVVREYCAGATRTAPSVQSCVGGHWKMQPCGPRGAERKFIHVEPYWRGPADAPIALRSHVLGGADAGR